MNLKLRMRAIAGTVIAGSALLLTGTAFGSGGGIDTGDGGGSGDGDRTGNRYSEMWDTFSYKDKRWARQTGKCESGNDPNAYNPSGPYYGAFQFLKSTWETSPRSPGGKPTRYNWKTQAVVAVKLKHRDGKGHWPVCG